jgi:hypothetical protein
VDPKKGHDPHTQTATGETKIETNLGTHTVKTMRRPFFVKFETGRYRAVFFLFIYKK